MLNKFVFRNTIAMITNNHVRPAIADCGCSIFSKRSKCLRAFLMFKNVAVDAIIKKN